MVAIQWRLGYRPELDGLRGFAVILVLLDHAGVAGFRSNGGAVGVGLFFVLSGFLITALLLEEDAKGGGIDLKAFWRRRFVRLLPALVVLLAVVVPGFHLAGGTTAGPRGVAAILLYVGNWSRVAGESLYPIGHTWSLAVEEQFYIVWPLLLVGVLRWRRTALVPTTATLLAVSAGLRVWFWFTHGDPTLRAYFATDTNAFMLLAGCLAAMLLRSDMRLEASPIVGWVSFAGLLIISGIPVIVSVETGVLLLDDSWTYLAAPLLTTLFGSVLCIWLGQATSTAWKWTPLASVGRISYGLYLWHLPILLAWGSQIRPVQGRLVETVALMAMSVVAAAASWYGVERPLMRFKTHSTPGKISGNATGSPSIEGPGTFPEARPHRRFRGGAGDL